MWQSPFIWYAVAGLVIYLSAISLGPTTMPRSPHLMLTLGGVWFAACALLLLLCWAVAAPNHHTTLVRLMGASQPVWSVSMCYTFPVSAALCLLHAWAIWTWQRFCLNRDGGR